MDFMRAHRVASCAAPAAFPHIGSSEVGRAGSIVFQPAVDRFERISSPLAYAPYLCARVTVPPESLNRLRVVVGMGRDDAAANSWFDYAVREVYRAAADAGLAVSFAQRIGEIRSLGSLRRAAAADGLETRFDLLERPAVVGPADTRRAVGLLGQMALPPDVTAVLTRFFWTLDAVEARDGAVSPVFDRVHIVMTLRQSLMNGMRALRVLDALRAAPGEAFPLLRLMRVTAVLSSLGDANDFFHKIHELNDAGHAAPRAFEGLALSSDLARRVGEIDALRATLPDPVLDMVRKGWGKAFEKIRKEGALSPEGFLRRVVALWATPEADAFVADADLDLRMVPHLEGGHLALARVPKGGGRASILFADPRREGGTAAQGARWAETAAMALHEHAGHVARFRERGPSWHAENLVASESEAFLIEVKHRLLAGDDFYLRYFKRYSAEGWEWGLRNVIEETYVRNRKPPELIPPTLARFLG